MKNYDFEHSSITGRSDGFVSYIVIALLTIIIIALLVTFFFAPETVTKFSRTSQQPAPGQQGGQITGNSSGENGQANSTNQAIQLTETELAEQNIKSPDGGPLSAADMASGRNGQGQRGSSATGDGSDTCYVSATAIESFFSTLDTRDYIKDFQLDKPSNIYFPELIQNLVNNPPIVSGETDDLFTILQNTAHFFRILGKKNIFVLKGILDRERETFEHTLKDFYLLTDEPACLKENFNFTIGQEELYAYAGFFLNTMGGRLYLFRRDSMSRMVVNYYAILSIEKANLEGRNMYGIEIKDAIDNLIIEIESSRIKLKLRDEYLDTLYDLKVKYQ